MGFPIIFRYMYFANRARGCLELIVGTFFHQRLGVRDDPAIVSNISIFAGPNLDTPESSMRQIYDYAVYISKMISKLCPLLPVFSELYLDILPKQM